MHSSKPPVYHNEEGGMMQRQGRTALENKAKKRGKRKLLKLLLSLHSSYLEVSTRIIELQYNNYWVNEGRQAIAIFLVFFLPVPKNT